jgi:hypothetical protein
LPKENLLVGGRLDEALKHLTEDATDPDHDQDLGLMRQELDIREASLDELQRVKANLSTHQGRITLVLSDFEAKLDISETRLSDEQKKLLRLNGDLNQALQRLKTTVGQSLSSPGKKFVTEADLSLLIREDESVKAKICDLIHRRFGGGNNQENEEAKT